MHWLSLLSCFFGGIFLANAAPHWISGVTGRPFPTPFAKPPGRGLSSPTVNVCWGIFNALIAYFLLFHAAHFHIQSLLDTTVTGIGFFLISLFSAHHFGRAQADTLSKLP